MAAADAGPLVVRMSSQGAAETTLETLDVLRVEAGRPAFLIDMDEHTIPLEAGIEDRAISFTKGCYVGQEVIVRVMHRGQGRVAKKLVGLLLATGRIAKSWCLDPRGGSGRRQGHQRGLVACTRARDRVGVRASGFRIGGNLPCTSVRLASSLPQKCPLFPSSIAELVPGNATPNCCFRSGWRCLCNDVRPWLSESSYCLWHWAPLCCPAYRSHSSVDTR